MTDFFDDIPDAPRPRDYELPDSLVSGILSNESGGKHYDAKGRVKLGPPTRTGSRAVGKWQVMPDAPGGRTRTIGGQTFDLYDETQNDAAGRAYLSEGLHRAKGDPKGAALYYFGGPRALSHYQRTGRLPAGSDGYTQISTYVQSATSKKSDFFADVPSAPKEDFFSDLPDAATPPLPTPAIPSRATGATSETLPLQPPPLSIAPTLPAPQVVAPAGLEAQQQLAQLKRPGSTTRGLIEPGNIDLQQRPVVKNRNGSISTVRSMSTNIDGREVLIPTVSEDGRILSDAEAIEQFKRTGKHLGTFETPEAATEFAKSLHERQARMYAPTPSTPRVARAPQRQTQPRRESVSSTADTPVQLEAPSVAHEQTTEIPFTPYRAEERSHLGRAAFGLGAMTRTFDNPPAAVNPDEVGKAVQLRVPATKGHPPSNYEVSLEVAKRISPEMARAVENYKRETGRDLLKLSADAYEGRLIQDPKGDYYDVVVSPTRAEIEIANAYNRGGVPAAEEAAAKITAQRKEYAERYASTLPQRKAHVAGEGAVEQAVVTGEGMVEDAMQGYLHFANNVSSFADAIYTGTRYGFDSPEYQRLNLSEQDTRKAMEAASQLLHAEAQEKGSAARIIRGIGSGVAQLPKYMMAGPYGAGVVAAIESADRGPRGMVEEGVKMNVLSALGELSGGLKSPTARQVAGRVSGGAFNVGAAALQGERDPRALAEQAAIGAGMSGPGRVRERTGEVAPRIAPTDRTARRSALDINVDVPVRTLEAPRVVKAETGMSEAAPVVETLSQPTQAQAVTPTEAAQHHSQFQPRRQRNTATGNKGQFRRGKPQIPEEVDATSSARPHTGPYEELDGGITLINLTDGRAALESAKGMRIGTYPSREAALANFAELKTVEADLRAKGVLPPDRLNAPVPDARAFREQMKREETAPPLSRPTNGRTAERSFPQSAEAAGLSKATNTTYEVNADADAVARASKRIETQGADKVELALRNSEAHSKDDIVAGQLLARKYSEEGNHEREVAVINDLADKLTKAGQTVQAASLISRLSPEGVLVQGQRILNRRGANRKLSVEEATSLKESAAKAREAEAKVSELQRQIEEMKLRPQRTPRAKLETLTDRLGKLESEARARLEARKQAAIVGSQAGASTIPLDIADYAIIGAAKLAKKGIDVAKWQAEMLAEFGDEIKPHLRRVYQASFQHLKDERAKLRSESQERAVRRENPNVTDAQEIRRLMTARLDAQTEARKARGELERTFNRLRRSPARRVLGAAEDTLGAARTILTGGDVSFGLRQGKMALRHPAMWVKQFARQWKALSETQAERMRSEMELDPDFKLMQKVGMNFTSLGHADPTMHEEGFQSRAIQKIPIFKHVERVNTAMLDGLRFNWIKSYIGHLRKMGLDPMNANDLKAFKEGATLIMDATGRADLGKFNEASRVASNLAFSPRFWLSRVKWLTVHPARILLPERAGGFSRPARVEAIKTLFAFSSVVAAQLAIARASGATVDLDPDSPDFLKGKWGQMRVDFSAGTQGHIRLALRLAKNVYESKMKGEKPKAEAGKIIGTYLRGKESPTASLVHDIFLSDKTKEGYGTDIIGKTAFPFGDPSKKGYERLKSSAVFKRVDPMLHRDAEEAYELMGWKGAVAAGLSSFVGEGVNTYQEGSGSASPIVPVPSPPKPPPLPKPKVTTNRLNLQGEKESANVEDVRLADVMAEVSKAGKTPVTDAEAQSIAHAVDSLEDYQAEGFLAHLDETRQMGALGEVVSKVGEWAALGLGNTRAEAVVRAQRVLARERRLRPAQFRRDALAGKYGGVIRDEVEGGYQYPQNQLPRLRVSQ